MEGKVPASANKTRKSLSLSFVDASARNLMLHTSTLFFFRFIVEPANANGIHVPSLIYAKRRE